VWDVGTERPDAKGEVMHYAFDAWMGRVFPNASIDRHSPSHTIRGEQQIE